MPTSNCSAPGGNRAMTSRNDSRQPVGHHLEMEEVAGPMAFEEELQDRPAGVDVEIERAVHELELPHAAVEQPLQFAEQRGQRRLPHGDVERRQAELAGERAAARGLDIDDAVRDVVVVVEIVGQRQLGELGQLGGNDLGKLPSAAPLPFSPSESASLSRDPATPGRLRRMPSPPRR